MSTCYGQEQKIDNYEKKIFLLKINKNMEWNTHKQEQITYC